MNDISNFIKKNEEYINRGMFKDVYEEAYENLSDDQTAKLTKMLTSALNIDAYTYAQDVILEKFTLALNDFKDNTNHDILILSSFVRMYMNHINGLDFYDFANLVSVYLQHYPQPGIEFFDDGFDLYLKQVN